MTLQKWLVVGVLAAVASSGVAACEADLSTTCVGGDTTCDGHEITGQGGELPCFESCDTTVVSGQTGEFPCEVEEVMTNCRRCHSANPLLFAGPFTLDSYEESQQLYGDTAIWASIAGQVGSGDMPLQAPDLTEAQKAAVVDWACSCGPPRAPGVTCN